MQFNIQDMCGWVKLSERPSASLHQSDRGNKQAPGFLECSQSLILNLSSIQPIIYSIVYTWCWLKIYWNSPRLLCLPPVQFACKIWYEHTQGLRPETLLILHVGLSYLQVGLFLCLLTNKFWFTNVWSLLNSSSNFFQKCAVVKYIK